MLSFGSRRDIVKSWSTAIPFTRELSVERVDEAHTETAEAELFSLIASLRNFCRFPLFVFLVVCGLLLSAECQEQKTYPVTLSGHTVIEIGYSFNVLPPEQRAQMISERLQKAADDPTVPASIKLVPSDPAIIDLMAGQNHLVSVLPGDATYAGVTSEALAREWAAAFEQAIREYRGQRSWGKRIEQLLLSLVTVAGAILLLFAIRKATMRLGTTIAARVEQRVERTHSQVAAVLPRYQLHLFVIAAFKVLRFVLSIAVIVFGFQLLLFFFPGTRYLASQLWNSIAASAYAFAANSWSHAPAIGFLVIVVITTWYLLKALRFFFRRVAEGNITIEGFRPSWASTTQRLVSILLVVLAILIAYPYIPGSESPAFKGVSIFLGLLVSLGSTGLVANIVGGIMLTYMDQFRVGDMIRVGDFLARVHKTSMLTTELHTRKNEIVTIPNSVILSQEVTNLSSSDKGELIINSTVGIGYDTPWRQVESILKLAASRTPGVSRTAEPFVYTMSLNQFEITHELNAHLAKDASYWATKSELNRNVLDAFNEFGVQIMTPSYEGDPEASKIVPKSRWFVAPAGAHEQTDGKSGQSFKQAG